MRVLAFTSATDLYAERFLSTLVQRGHDAALVCAPDKAEIVRQRTPQLRILRTAPARSRLDRESIRIYREAIREFQPDVAVVYTSRVLSLVRLAVSAFPDLPVVGSRGALSGVSMLNPPDWLTYLSPRVDAIVCMSRAIEAAMRATVHWPCARLADRFVTIYQGYDLLLERESQRPLDEPPWSFARTGVPVCMCIGNDRPIKGYGALLDAVAMLPDSVAMSLIMIGQLAPATENRIRTDARLSGRVRMLGYVPDARAALGFADFYVQPTQPPGEGIGNAIAEAMSHGLAVVTGDVGGSTELVADGDNGLQVDTRQPVAISAALAMLAGDAQLRETMGRRGRERLTQAFSMTACVDGHLRLFGSLLGRRERAGAVPTDVEV